MLIKDFFLGGGCFFIDMTAVETGNVALFYRGANSSPFGGICHFGSKIGHFYDSCRSVIKMYFCSEGFNLLFKLSS